MKFNISNHWSNCTAPTSTLVVSLSVKSAGALFDISVEILDVSLFGIYVGWECDCLNISILGVEFYWYWGKSEGEVK